jgi:hypothetical protein
MSDYGPGDRGSIPGSGREDFFPLASVSRPALGPTPVSYRVGIGGNVLRGRDDDHSLPSNTEVKWVGSIPPFPSSASMPCSGTAVVLHNMLVLLHSFKVLAQANDYSEHKKMTWQETPSSLFQVLASVVYRQTKLVPCHGWWHNMNCGFERSDL